MSYSGSVTLPEIKLSRFSLAQILSLFLSFWIAQSTFAACKITPQFFTLKKNNTKIQTTVFNPLVVKVEDETLSLLSVKNNKGADFSPYFIIDSKRPEFQKSSAIWIEPLSKNYTPKKFANLSPIEFVFLGQTTQKKYKLSLVISKTALQPKAACKKKPKII